MRAALIGAAAVVAGAILGPVGSGRAEDASQPVPDSARLETLRRQLDGRPTRVRGSFGSVDIDRPILAPEGIGSRAWTEHSRPALIRTGDVTVKPARPPIPWNEIAEIQSGRTHTLQGAVGGLFVGVAVGGLLAGTHASDAGEEEGMRAISLFFGSVMAGTMIGALVGSIPRWRTVYRADRATD
jgi:hypothetical protein